MDHRKQHPGWIEQTIDHSKEGDADVVEGAVHAVLSWCAGPRQG